MHVLVTGGNGMLGTAVCARFAKEGSIVSALSRSDADITDTNAIRTAILRFEPDIVIHTAAMTDVDGCERDPAAAYLVNAIGTKNVAAASAEARAKLIVISTDFVFDGEKSEAYIETDRTHPLNVYGASKLAGEEMAQEICLQTYVVRTSWLFGAIGKCFPKTILKLASTRSSFNVVADQVGSPTYVQDVAKVLVKLNEKAPFGLYHVANSGQTSWYGFAKEVLDIMKVSNVTVNPIPAGEWPSPAKRPAYSALTSPSLAQLGISLLPPWQTALRNFLTKEISLTGLA